MILARSMVRRWGVVITVICTGSSKKSYLLYLKGFDLNKTTHIVVIITVILFVLAPWFDLGGIDRE
jgi:Tfp pilus assembly ATPase PilU